MGDTLQDTEVGKNFENSIGIGPRNNRWDYMKIKIFFRAKQRTGGNFSSYTSNKKLVARIHKESQKLNIKGIKVPKKQKSKWTE